MAKNSEETKPTADTEVQALVNVETEQGFRGVEVDVTPNENYTLSGVTSGKPTPETDPEQARKAREGRADAEAKACGAGER